MEGKGKTGKWGSLWKGLLGVGLVLALAAFIWYRSGLPVQDSGDPLPVPADSVQASPEGISGGIHVQTGFRAGEGLPVVISNCTPCHSAELVTQNRMTREGWESTIRWMQETQNLWELGDNEAVILDYLATYYAPEEKGRRQNLENIEWYELEP
ncbi:cytochrome C [Robiginitalea sp. SC105]|uniref:cytochrome C n=1 Tax=Robiginitalea sp. SC105 TaxID=2762332 RepID=UPI00163B0D32|nr:cytochrome C [Robiginitalea sp. SC105]MBC2838114.1 cytochrome C [Robiginitalea sp. SC105]